MSSKPLIQPTTFKELVSTTGKIYTTHWGTFISLSATITAAFILLAHFPPTDTTPLVLVLAYFLCHPLLYAITLMSFIWVTGSALIAPGKINLGAAIKQAWFHLGKFVITSFEFIWYSLFFAVAIAFTTSSLEHFINWVFPANTNSNLTNLAVYIMLFLWQFTFQTIILRHLMARKAFSHSFQIIKGNWGQVIAQTILILAFVLPAKWLIENRLELLLSDPSVLKWAILIIPVVLLLPIPSIFRTLFFLMLETSNGLAPDNSQPVQEEGKTEMKDEANKILDVEGIPAALDYLDSDDFPTPAARVQGYHELMKHAYWQRKDLPATIQIGQAGIAIGDALADTYPDQSSETFSQVKAIYYDLASFTWPGWDEPGISITAEQIQLGLQAAERNLQLATDLNKPPIAFCRAYWMLAAQEIAVREYRKAGEHFALAEQSAQQAGASAEQLLSKGFILVTGLLADPEEKALVEKLNEIKTALQEVEHGSNFVQQIEDALRVFGD